MGAATRGYWELVDPIWDAISIYDGYERFNCEFQSASTGARTQFAAHWCQSEICNGGMLQFFHNSTGVLAPEAVAGFRALDMPKVAALVDAGCAWFGADYPREREARVECLKAHDPQLSDHSSPFVELDDQFFKLIEAENGGFEAAADAFAGQHGGYQRAAPGRALSVTAFAAAQSTRQPAARR